MAQVEITQMQEKEIRIFETVLKHVAEVIAFDRFYVALYDRRNASLYFPLVQLEDGARLTLPEISDRPWTAHPYNPEKQWPDCLLRPDAPLPNGSDSPTWLATHDINYQPDPQPCSWLIAPLKARGAVMGVLVAEDLHRDRAYDEELQTWFAAIANRVSGTLSSLRLVESLRTVNRVGQYLTAEARQDIPQVLDLIHEQASLLLDARDMYIALYDPGLQKLRFPLAYHDGSLEKWPARQMLKIGATEEVIRNRQPLRLDNYRQWYAEKGEEPQVKPEESPKSWIGVPLLSGDQVLGVIALQNDEVEGLYSEDDQDILQTMASQAAAAIANARLVERLRAVNEVGQRLTSGARLEKDEILNLIYEQAGRLMDTRDMFIAFYDTEKQELSFPLFYVDGESIEWESRPVDLEDASQRKLTEEVLYTGEALNVSNFSQWFEERGRPVPEKPPKSWLGVPLMIEDRVLGVIALQNDEIENLYGLDDVEVLQAMASQAAFAVLALENARLLNQICESQEQVIAAERMAAVASIAGELVHKMNNLAGTIPARVRLIKEKLDFSDTRDQRIDKILGDILADSVRLLDQAKRIRESTAPEAVTSEDANELLQLALARVRRAFTEKFESSEILVTECYATFPLKVEVQRNPLVSALENIIRNAVEAMPEGGILTLQSDLQDDKVILRISDTGKSIDLAVLPRLFDPFYTTKPGGMGFGLWQARTVARSVGGDIEVEPSKNGTCFRIVFPPHFSSRNLSNRSEATHVYIA